MNDAHTGIMTVHIGKIIQAEVEYKRLTHKEFGALINRNEKTVPDIYSRATMSIDLLVTISVALKKDFLKFFYDEEPMKSIRDDETTKLNNKVQRLVEKNQNLQEKLDLAMLVIEANKKALLLKDVLERIVPSDVYISPMNEVEKSYKQGIDLPIAKEDKEQNDSNS